MRPEASFVNLSNVFFSRHKIEAAREKTKALQGQMDQLAKEQLPQLLRDMASLQVMRVLHGNYTLKLARQQYYLSKQNQVGRGNGYGFNGLDKWYGVKQCFE